MLNIELSCFSVYFLFQICRCKRGGLGGGTDTWKLKKRIVFQWVLQGLSQLQNLTVAPVRCLSGWPSSHCSLGKQVAISNAVCASEFQEWKSGSGSWSLGFEVRREAERQFAHPAPVSQNASSSPPHHTSLPMWQLSHTKPSRGPFNDSNRSFWS